jgi:succinyl-diaminopimelate desuccinylase
MPGRRDAAAILGDLIRCRSVTPADGGAQGVIAAILSDAGFRVDRMTFSAPGTPDVENLFASIGNGAPHLVFAGHTDVVPPGDESRWTRPPFGGEVAEGAMFGRGAVDMKGGIASFLAAALAHVSQTKSLRGTLSLAITGDEEGPGVNGTAKLVEWAVQHGHRFDAALVGEPTSRSTLGDTIKIGRRGSLSATLTVFGRQGHVAYPHLADNPVPHLMRLLSSLTALRLDDGSAAFQPSNLEVTTVDVGNQASNVIPGEATARFNVRYNDAWTPASLEARLRAVLDAAAEGRIYRLAVLPGASQSFLTQPGPLVGELSAAIEDVTGLTPDLSTSGGTSDARFFKSLCPVVEFGLVGDTMHQIDEHVPLADLDRLTSIYRRFLERFFGARP